MQQRHRITRRAGVNPELWWDFKPDERVMTVDGIPGRVIAVHDGPLAGMEEYEVVLDNGLGGGAYTSGQLASLHQVEAVGQHEGEHVLAAEQVLAAGQHLATEDYPELGSILHDRPDPGLLTFSAAKVVPSFARAEADSEDHDEPDPEMVDTSLGEDTSQPSACSYCGGTEFDLTDNGRVQQATCTTCRGTMSAHEGAQWTPELIGDPSNHPSAQVDPRSGASPGGRTPGVNDFDNWADAQHTRIASGALCDFAKTAAVDGPDWCTWRRTARCTYPGDISAGGHVLGIPQDRGPCPWETRWQQQVCPISEPGPGAGMDRKGALSAGPCDTCDGKGYLERREADPHFHGDLEDAPTVTTQEHCEDCGGTGHVDEVGDNELERQERQRAEYHVQRAADHMRNHHANGEGPGYGCPPWCPAIQRHGQRMGSTNLVLVLPEGVSSTATHTAALEARMAADDDYRMQHQAPGADYGAPLHDVENMMPDFYTHPHYYDHGQEHFHDSAHVIRGARNQPEKMINVYRALPGEHAHKGIRPGDWVSTSKDYARGEGRMHDSKDDYPVIHARVPAKHLHTEGDVHEWGYNGPATVSGRVVFKGGYNQEVRHNAQGEIKQVKRKPKSSEKQRAEHLEQNGYTFSHYKPPPHGGDHTVVAYDSEDNWAGMVKADSDGKITHSEVQPEHKHMPLEEHMHSMLPKTSVRSAMTRLASQMRDALGPSSVNTHSGAIDFDKLNATTREYREREQAGDTSHLTPHSSTPQSHRLDDKHYTVDEVSKHYGWEGFDAQELHGLHPEPHHALFTREEVPVSSLRLANGPTPSYRDIASQGSHERERLEQVEQGYQEGKLPPIVVARDGEHHVIADGSHRAAVAAHHGRTHVEAFVTGPHIYDDEDEDR